MSDTIWAAIISGSCGLVGVIIGLLWNRNATKKAVEMSFNKATDLLERQEFIKAGNRFKTAFIDTRILLKDSYWYKPFDTHLTERISIERRAVDDFLIYLPESKRIEIEEAWQNYRRKNDEDFSNEYLLTEEEIADNHEREKDVKSKILDRIEKLEKFADHEFVFDK